MGDKWSCEQSQNGINSDFQVKFDLEDQGQSTPKPTGILTILKCIYGQNLMILTWRGEKLLCNQAQDEVNFKFQVKFDLDGQSLG